MNEVTEASSAPDPDDEALAAAAHLSAVDSRLAELVDSRGAVSPYLWPGFPVPDGDLLGGLTLHIVSQQISTAVALTLFGRLTATLGGAITADGLAAATVEQLRAAGLSGAKARSLHELGERIVAETFSLQALRDLDDSAAEAELVSLRGVGPWSAQTFLLHELRRPDVFPAGDIALRHTLARLDGLDTTPDIKSARDRASIWSPYRSYAAAYLWSWPPPN
jgi:DNA-3-methyladenine glycosylase II